MPKALHHRINPRAGHPWAIHVYGPVLRRNPDYPGDLIPVFALHDPKDNYQTFLLADVVQHSGVARYQPENPLPAGVGGSVVAYILTEHPITITTTDPWNWVDGEPPRVTVVDGMSKTDLYKEVIRTYSKMRRG